MLPLWKVTGNGRAAAAGSEKDSSEMKKEASAQILCII